MNLRVLALLALAALGGGACRGGKGVVRDAAVTGDAPRDQAMGDVGAREAGADAADVAADSVEQPEAAADHTTDVPSDLPMDQGGGADAVDVREAGPPADAAPDLRAEVGIDSAPSDRPPMADAQTGNRAVQIVAGGRFTCALMSDGAASCWGLNNEGQLGDGTLVSRTAAAPVLGLPWAPQRLEAGWAFVCALRDGAVYCWGRGTEGQLGDGTFTSRPTPAAVTGLGDARVLRTGGDAEHICAVRGSGALSCWGFNAFGQLGDGTTTNRALPTDLPGMTDVALISCSVELTCVASAAGATRCWGGNAFGQLGDGTTTTRAQPIEPIGLGPVAALATGYGQTCAVLRAGGAVWCWGSNGHGEIGDGTVTQRRMPVSASGLAGAVSVAAGVYHSCAFDERRHRRVLGLQSGR